MAAAYDSNGSLLWEAFAAMATVWATALPSGDVCVTGGYDALVTCWSASGAGVVNPPVVNPPALPTAPEQLIAQALSGRSIRLVVEHGRRSDRDRRRTLQGSELHDFAQVATVPGIEGTLDRHGPAVGDVQLPRARAQCRRRLAVFDTAGARTIR